MALNNLDVVVVVLLVAVLVQVAGGGVVGSCSGSWRRGGCSCCFGFDCQLG